MLIPYNFSKYVLKINLIQCFFTLSLSLDVHMSQTIPNVCIIFWMYVRACFCVFLILSAYFFCWRFVVIVVVFDSCCTVLRCVCLTCGNFTDIMYTYVFLFSHLMHYLIIILSVAEHILTTLKFCCTISPRKHEQQRTQNKNNKDNKSNFLFVS